MVTRLVLIRHGITQWNREGRYCGCKDIGLSSEGVLQAKRLSKKLEFDKFDKIYSSDRKRALQTARIIFKQAKIARVSALREINFGVFEGLRHKEIVKKYALVYKKWLDDPYQVCIPGQEPMSVFKKRVKKAIKNITRVNSGKNLAIVCHGGVISVFVSSILKSRNFWRYCPAPASMTVIKYKQGRFSIQS